LSLHPLALRNASLDTSSVAGAYNNDPVNGITSGTIYFTPNNNTPSQIVYQCTIHSSMIGTIIIKDRYE